MVFELFFSNFERFLHKSSDLKKLLIQIGTSSATHETMKTWFRYRDLNPQFLARALLPCLPLYDPLMAITAITFLRAFDFDYYFYY